jgi:hypothetical protein
MSQVLGILKRRRSTGAKELFCNQVQETLQMKAGRVVRKAICGGRVTWKQEDAQSQARM